VPGKAKRSKWLPPLHFPRTNNNLRTTMKAIAGVSKERRWEYRELVTALKATREEPLVLKVDLYRALRAGGAPGTPGTAIAGPGGSMISVPGSPGSPGVTHEYNLLTPDGYPGTSRAEGMRASGFANPRVAIGSGSRVAIKKVKVKAKRDQMRLQIEGEMIYVNLKRFFGKS